MGILAIIGMWGSKWLTTWLPRMRVQNAAREVQAVLYQSRMAAIKRNRDVAVYFDVDDQTVRAYYCTNDPCDLDEDELIREIDFKLDSGTRFVEFVRPGADAVEGFTTLAAGELGAVFDGSGTLLDTGGVSLAYRGTIDYFEVDAATQSGIVEILKYLQDGDSPTGTAGFFPKANEAGGESLWVWYGG
jgi:hypothetical protein